MKCEINPNFRYNRILLQYVRYKFSVNQSLKVDIIPDAFLLAGVKGSTFDVDGKHHKKVYCGSKFISLIKSSLTFLSTTNKHTDKHKSLPLPLLLLPYYHFGKYIKAKTMCNPIAFHDDTTNPKYKGIIMDHRSQLRWTKTTCSPSIPPHPVPRRMSNDRWNSIDSHIYPPNHPKQEESVTGEWENERQHLYFLSSERAVGQELLSILFILTGRHQHSLTSSYKHKGSKEVLCVSQLALWGRSNNHLSIHSPQHNYV